MKRFSSVMVVAFAVVLGGAATAAAADEAWNYRNPAQPSKNPDDLKDSQYVGWHYERKWESYRTCVASRESGGNYKADGPYGSGAYQFIQSTWDEAMRRARKPEWVGVRPHKAPPYVQDEAFWVMANPTPKLPGLRGRHHWSSRWAKEVLGVNVKDC